jgi:hypothetical protein
LDNQIWGTTNNTNVTIWAKFALISAKLSAPDSPLVNVAIDILFYLFTLKNILLNVQGVNSVQG